METKLTAWLVTHVHAVEREHMQVHVESERAVGALHGSDSTGMRIGEARQPELLLRSPLEGTAELAEEGAGHQRA
jgi:hypothetical protein